jgi:hypothetical protein
MLRSITESVRIAHLIVTTDALRQIVSYYMNWRSALMLFDFDSNTEHYE